MPLSIFFLFIIGPFPEVLMDQPVLFIRSYMVLGINLNCYGQGNCLPILQTFLPLYIQSTESVLKMLVTC